MLAGMCTHCDTELPAEMPRVCNIGCLLRQVVRVGPESLECFFFFLSFFLLSFPLKHIISQRAEFTVVSNPLQSADLDMTDSA